MPTPSAFRRPDPALLGRLRARIGKLERPAPEGRDFPGTVALGAAEIDDALPWGGLPRAALHEVIGADAGAAAGFCAALLARLAGAGGCVLWCRRRRGLYGPGLAAFGLGHGRLIVVRGRRDTDVLWVMEEGLRGGGPAAVLGEVDGLTPTAARRLQLAAEGGGVPALLLRPAGAEAVPGPAVTRWRVGAASSVSLGGLRGVGAPRWRVDLLRCRGGAAEAPRMGESRGAPRSWLVEWRDGTTGGFAVAADLRHRPAEPAAEGVEARSA